MMVCVSPGLKISIREQAKVPVSSLVIRSGLSDQHEEIERSGAPSAQAKAWAWAWSSGDRFGKKNTIWKSAEREEA